MAPNIIPASIAGGGWSSPMGEDINQKIAFALMAQQMKPQQIQSPWQGAAEMANSALAGAMYRKAQDNQMSGYRAIGNIYGGGGGAPTPAPQSSGGPLGFLGGLFGGGGANTPAPPQQTASIPPTPNAAPTAAAPPYAGIAGALADKQQPVASDGMAAPVPPADIPAGNMPMPPANPLAGLNPQFRDQFAELRAKAAQDGVHFDAPPAGSLGGVRTQTQQNKLYAQGRTAPGPIVTGTRNSNHIKGLALDVVPTDGSTERQVGREVTKLVRNDPEFAGMRSGATFSNLYDPLHVELNRPGIAPTQLAGNAQQPQQGSSLQYAALANPQAVRGSVFGNGPGGFHDPMNGSGTASGIPTSQPGIALPSRAGLSPGAPQFQVTAPNGQSAVLPQTDVGPAQWTGRGVDVSAGAAPQIGYGPNNFPTDARFNVQPVVPLPPQRPNPQVASNDPNFVPQMGGQGPQNIVTSPMGQAAVLNTVQPDPGVIGQPPSGPPIPAGQQTAQLAPPPGGGPVPPQMAQNAPQLAPQPQPQQQAPQITNPMVQMLTQQRARAAAYLQNARTPQEAAIASQALMTANQQLMQLQMPQVEKLGMGDQLIARQLDPSGKVNITKLYGNNPTLSPDAQSQLSDYLAAGGDPTKLGLPRNPQQTQIWTDLQNEAARRRQQEGAGVGKEMLARQGDVEGMKSAQKSAGTRLGLLEQVTKDAENIIPLAKGASDAIPRTQYPSLNAAMNAFNEHVGDPNIVRLHTVVYGLANLYARAVNPTNPSDNGFKHAFDLLNAGYSHGQFDAAVGQLQQEIAGLTRGGAQAGQAIHHGYVSGELPPAPQIPGQAPPAQTGQTHQGLGVSPAEAAAPITSKAQYDSLPSGTRYVAPDGSVRTKR